MTTEPTNLNRPTYEVYATKNAEAEAPPLGKLDGSVSSRASRLALNDESRNVQAEVMMSRAMRVTLGKRARRETAETIWL